MSEKSCVICHRLKLLVSGSELFIGTTRFHLTPLHEVDLIALAHGREAMRDQDDGDVAEVVHRFHHRLFGEVVTADPDASQVDQVVNVNVDTADEAEIVDMILNKTE